MSCVCRAALANELAAEALFDEGVEAARNACVAGATLAAAAITASAWYDNPLTGARALRDCLEKLGALPLSVDAWRAAFAPGVHPETGDAFAPGFGYVEPRQESWLLASASRLAECPRAEKLRFYLSHCHPMPSSRLNVAGLAALVYCDHGLSLDDAEREFLLCRVDVALREAARARTLGIARFPFFSDAYFYEGASPPARTRSLSEAMRRVGL
ncbi:MAG TPA: hypothetical protein VFQ35_04050 [Polyangiaceae bacterium]|nr:hypothetical protein [Polyangiaceae bacterium]